MSNGITIAYLNTNIGALEPKICKLIIKDD